MKNLDWNHLRAFHATAAAGSLSAASRRLGLTQPTLSRQIAALEDALGVPLFDRVGRRLVLTSTGQHLLEHVRSMEDAAEAVALAASGSVQDISGRVCISATDIYAADILPDIIGHIRAKAPHLTIEILADNGLSNLHQREADIAIRFARPDRPGLVGQHIRDAEAYLYASEEWIARHGLPDTAADLSEAALIALNDAESVAAFLRGWGLPVEAGGVRMVSNSAVAIWQMVRRGLGVAPMLREIADRTPGIVKLLPGMPPIVVPLWLVTHREVQSSPRIRLVQGILADQLTRF